MAKVALDPPWCGVIGQPVMHSLSPLLFGALAKRLAQPLSYRRIEVAPRSLREFLVGMRAAHVVAGLNVTLPHKQAVLKHADWVSPEALAVGAANVLAFEQGEMTAHNTDVLGVRMTLKEHHVRVRGRTALVYGAGGAARAVAYALAELEAQRLVIVNRTIASARNLVQDLAPQFPQTQFEARADVQVDAAVGLVVNATSLGMVGQPSFNLEFPPLLLPDGAAFDVVYRPARTSFLKCASALGLVPIGGLPMLVWQALGAYELWFGPLTHARAHQAALLRLLQREVRS